MSDYDKLKKEWEDRYQQDLSYLQKGCIVIGCAPSMLLNKWGPLIDRFNTVVRLNSYKIEGYEEHVGTKTDIWARAKNYEIAFRDGMQFKEVWIKKKWDRTRRDGLDCISSFSAMVYFSLRLRYFSFFNGDVLCFASQSPY